MKPLKISKDIALPSGRRALEGNRARLRLAFKQMKIGDSVMWPNNHDPYDVAEDCQITISTRKISGKGYRVWRVDKK